MSASVSSASAAALDAEALLRRLARTFQAGLTTPERLHRVALVLVVGCVVTAVVSVLAGVARSNAVQDSGTRIAALSADAAELYQSLADADATATRGYVSGGLEPTAVRARYDADIARAADRVVHAANGLPVADPAAAQVAVIASQLATYAGLMETARAYNREGLPLGQAYLSNASRLMSTTILPAVEQLRQSQKAALASAYQRGGAMPYAVLLLGIAALAGVVDHAVLERRRTNKILNTGLLAAGLALVAALLWWAVAVIVAGDHLDAARRHSDAAIALDNARTAVLLARSNESLVLVARSGSGSSDQGFTTQVQRVSGLGGDDGLLAEAVHSVPAAAVQVQTIRTALEDWRAAHRHVRELDDGGHYLQAVASVTGDEPTGSKAAFERLGAVLEKAIVAERGAFTVEDSRAGSVLTGLTVGPAVLTLLAAVAAIVGIGRRVAEYR
ncbi:MAG: hypothetical protein JO287_20920 [Pseudonocardiales bacterium]|nr:hypothetical protein [Pseudonocardiales bacterium]